MREWEDGELDQHDQVEILPSDDDEDDFAAEKRAAQASGAWSEEKGEDGCEDDSGSEEEEDPQPWQGPFFPELVQQIKDAILALGGSVFPRLDWHSPSDASWITTDKSLRCETVGDVLLLLKSSEDVASDVTGDVIKEAVDGSTEAAAAAVEERTCHLILRRWMEMRDMSEFRCFVQKGQLTGEWVLPAAADSCAALHVISRHASHMPQSPLNPERSNTLSCSRMPTRSGVQPGSSAPIDAAQTEASH